MPQRGVGVVGSPAPLILILFKNRESVPEKPTHIRKPIQYRGPRILLGA